MSTQKIQNNRGLVKMIVIIVIALIVLGYLGFNLREIVNSPTVQDNFGYAKELILSLWNNYLKTPATYIWNDIFLRLIWNPGLTALERMKDGGPAILPSQSTKLQTMASSTFVR